MSASSISASAMAAACALYGATAAAQPMPAPGHSSTTTTTAEPQLPTTEVRSAPGSPSLQNLPTAASVLDGTQMREHQMQINLSESMQGIAGLQIRNRQNLAQDLQLSIRGYGARSSFGIRGVQLYVDGIPASMPDGQGSLSHIDIASVERVEVLRGPYSALYGNSAGGVVSVFTETPEGPPTLESGFAVGSSGQKRLSAKASGQTAQGISYVLSASRYLTDGWREHSAADRTIANAKLSTAPNADSRLTLVANAMQSNAQDPQGLTWQNWQSNPRASTAASLNFNTRKHLEQQQLGLNYERRLNARDSLSLMLYAGHRSMQAFQSIPVAAQAAPGHAGGVIGLSRNFMGLDARWTSRFSDAPVPVTLTAGLSLSSMRDDRQGYENLIGSTLGVQGRLRRDEIDTATSVSPYVQASWQLAPRWSLDTGLRYSQVTFKTQDHYIAPGNPDDSGRIRHHKAQPVASLTHQLNPDQTMYVSAGRGFETPTFTELSYRPDHQGGMNLGLLPSTSTQYELGWRQRLQGRVKGQWSAALFQANTSDEIVTATAGNGRTTYRNAGKTRRQGLELQAELRLHPQWQLQAAYTYLDASFRQGGGDATAGKLLPGIAKQQLWLALNYQISPAWRASLSAQRLTRVYVNDANDAAAPGYTVAHASLGYRREMGPWLLTAFARVDNLFDRQYVGSVIVNGGNQQYYEPAPGRSWSTGASLAYRF